jgi:hypothetical protein
VIQCSFNAAVCFDSDVGRCGGSQWEIRLPHFSNARRRCGGIPASSKANSRVLAASSRRYLRSLERAGRSVFSPMAKAKTPQFQVQVEGLWRLRGPYWYCS